MNKQQCVEPGKVITILFNSPWSKPLEVVINHSKHDKFDKSPVYISPHTPLSKAIINHKSGEKINFKSPEGKLEVRIISVGN